MAPPGWLIRRLNLLPSARARVSADGRFVDLHLGQGPVHRLEPVSLMGLSHKHVVRLALATTEADVARLLLVESIRPLLRERLAASGASWAERDAGFLHLNIPSCFVRDSVPSASYISSIRTTGVRAGGKSVRPTRLVGRSGRCAESMLLRVMAQGGVPASVTPALLAELAGVSVQLGLKVLRRLEGDGVAERRRGQGETNWVILQPERMLDLWLAEDTRKARVTRAYIWARSPRELLGTLTRIGGIVPEWAIGGVAAANIYAPTLTADPTPSVWIPDQVPVDLVVKGLGGEVVTDGGFNVEFRQIRDDPWALNRFPSARPSPEVATPGDAVSSQIGVPGHDGSRRPEMVTDPVHPSVLERLPALSLVSRVRAYVETVHDGRGRALEVAEALRERLGLDSAEG